MTMNTSVLFTALSFIAGAQLFGCAKSSPETNDTSTGDTDDEAAPSQCDPGDTRECVGSGACKGGQRCEDDAKWGECDCLGSLPAGTTGSDAESSAPSGTGSKPTPPSNGNGPVTDASDASSVGPSATASPPIPAHSADAGSITDPATEPDPGPSVASAPSRDGGKPDAPSASQPTPTDASVLGIGYELADPLIVAPWQPVLVRSETVVRTDLGMAFNVGFMRGGSLYADPTKSDIARPYEAPGEYCPCGQAVGTPIYRKNGDIPPGFQVLIEDPSQRSQRWTPTDYNVVGVQFELTETPETGIEFGYVGGDEEITHAAATLQNGVHTILFQESTSDPLPPGSPKGSVPIAMVDGILRGLLFQVHHPSVTERTKYDFCVRNIRFLLQ